MSAFAGLPADKIAAALTASERTALLSLPLPDSGHMADGMWWEYYSLYIEGLMETDGKGSMIVSPLGRAVLTHCAPS